LITYPNPFIFTNAVQYQALYNGQLTIGVNNSQMLYSWDLQRHYNAPQTQHTAAAGAGSPIDQANLSDDCFYPFQPYVLFGGAQNVDLQIRLAVAPNAIDANSRLVMIFRGVLAQNSTPVS